MSWPSLQDYNEAIQNPRFCFTDPELQRGTAECNALGLPKVNCGNFASVYQMFCSGRTYAVRCFTTYRTDQDQRYAIIGQYLRQHPLRAMVEFSFLSQGIQVQGKQYPIVKMEWIDAEPLDTYIENHLGRPLVLRSLADGFLDLVSELRRASIAHADLQHGNILVVNGNLRLIDYDGMYVPGLAGKTSDELGHRNYQHPKRSAAHFGPYLDHFAAWSIYLSLLALSIEPNLWTEVRTGDEQLLFRQDDFEHPERSRAFHALKRIYDPQIQFLVPLFESFLARDILNIPPLDRNQLSSPVSTPTSPVSHPSGPSHSGDHGMSVHGATAPVPPTFVGLSWIADHLERLPEVGFTPRLFVERSLIAFVSLGVGGLSFASRGGMLELEIASVGAAGLLAFAFLSLRRSFARRPEVVQKAHLAKALRKVQSEIADMQSVLDGLSAQLQQRKRAELDLAEDLRIQQQALVQREQFEIGQVNDGMQRHITQLRVQRQALDQGEANEIDRIRRELQRFRDDLQTHRHRLHQKAEQEVAEALKNLQQHSLSSQLTHFRLDRANIPGIGDGLKKRLAAKGIRTAADIRSVHITQVFRGGHPHEIASIEVPGQGRVHVEGIGPIKATALRDWQQGIASRFRSSMPWSLPPAAETAIREKYRSEQHSLDAQETNASTKASQEETAVRSKYQRSREALDWQEAKTNEDGTQKREQLRTAYRLEQETLRRRIEAARQKLAKECSDIEHEISEKQKRLVEKQWELTACGREVDAYREVNFRTYLKQIVFLRKKP